MKLKHCSIAGELYPEGSQNKMINVSYLCLIIKSKPVFDQIYFVFVVIQKKKNCRLNNLT